MTELITIDAAKAGAKFSLAVRKARALVTDELDDIVRDLLQVQASQMVTDALTPEMRALIIAAGKQGHYEMVEVMEPIRPDKIVEVCVKAYMAGLQLSGQQFAVFGQRGGEATLYVKANGYRHRFATSGRAGVVRCNVGYPEVVPLASNPKKAVALMTGTASVKWDGETVTVDAPAAYRIGIPCYASDNIDGLQAKAERRLLKQLWTACTGIMEVDAETDDAVTVEAVAIETSSGRDWENERASYRAEWQQLGDIAKPVYAELMKADTTEELEGAFASSVALKMPAKDREAFIRAMAWQRERLEAMA